MGQAGVRHELGLCSAYEATSEYDENNSLSSEDADEPT
jgi:hypothetical protein